MMCSVTKHVLYSKSHVHLYMHILLRDGLGKQSHMHNAWRRQIGKENDAAERPLFRPHVTYFVSSTGCVLASAHVACRAAVTLVVRKVLPPNRRHGRNGLKNEKKKKRPRTPRET